MLLSQVLLAFKQGVQLPEWFQKFARKFAACPRHFVSLDASTQGCVLTDDLRGLYADESVSHFVAAVVSSRFR